MAGDAFTRQRFAWLDQVAADPELTSLGFRVAYAIAGRMNRTLPYAYGNQEKFATQCHATVSGFRKAVEQLKLRGHLQVQSGNGRPLKGSGASATSSRYFWILKEPEKVTQGEHLLTEKGDLPETPFQDQKADPHGAPSFGKGAPEIAKRCPVQDKKGAPYGSTNPLSNNPKYLTLTPADFVDVVEVKTTKKKSKSTSIDGFDEFYREYPRHKARDDAEKAYGKIIQSGRATAAELLAGAARARIEMASRPPDKVPYPASWLRAGCWLDEPEFTHTQQPQQYRPAKTSGIASAIAGARSALDDEEFFN